MRQASSQRQGTGLSTRPATIRVALAVIWLAGASVQAGESSTRPSSSGQQAEVPAALLARLRAQYIPEESDTPDTSESDKVRRYQAILREGGYVEKLYAKAPNLHEVRELMMAAAKGLATLEGTDEARQVLLDVARRLVNSAAPPESRVVAEMLLMRARIDELAQYPAEAVDELAAFAARYQGTAGEAKAMVGAAALCEVADADPARGTYLKRLSEKHFSAPGVIEYLQAQGLNPNAGRLVSAKLTCLDGSTIVLPRDTLGRFTALHFWTVERSGLVSRTSRGESNDLSLYQAFRKEGGEIVSINLDEDRQRVARFIRDECKGMDWPQTCSGLGLKDPMFRRFYTPTMPAYWLVGPDGRVISDAYSGRGGQQWSSFIRTVQKTRAEVAEMALRIPYYRSGAFLLDLPLPTQTATPGAADVPGEQLDELRRKAPCPPAPGLDKDKQAAAFREMLELGRAIERKYPQAGNLPSVRCAMLVGARWLATQTSDKALARQAQEIAAQILGAQAQGAPRLLAEYVRMSDELAGEGISREDSAGKIDALVKKHAGGDLNWAACVCGVMLATECGDEGTRVSLVEELRGHVEGNPKVRGFLRGCCDVNVDATTTQGQRTPVAGGPTPWEVRGELPLLGGGKLRLEDLKGKMVMIHFWSVACPAITPELIAARTRIDSRTKTKQVLLPADLSPDPRYDMVIVGVNLDRSRDDVEKYLKQHSEYDSWIHVFSGLGRDDPLARELDIYGLPRSVLLDREGKIYRWGYPGQAVTGIKYQVFAPPDALSNPSPTIPAPRPGSKIGYVSPEQAAADAELPKAISLDVGGKAFMKLALVPAGGFYMGSSTSDRKSPNYEEAQQRRYLTRPFYMGVHHVTRGQFAAFVRQTNYKTEAEREGWALLWKDGWHRVEGASWRNCGFDQADDHPVVCVSWNDAVEFCNWLGRTAGRAVHLPTETQWEYACRAGTVTRYPWGSRPEDGNGWCNGADLSVAGTSPAGMTFDWNDGYAFTSPVGKFKANAFGLYDMTGNAWQWCSDWYGSYTLRQRNGYYDPVGPETGTYRVTRGGSWNSGPDYCRSAARRKEPPAACTNTLGFRVVVDPPQLAK